MKKAQRETCKWEIIRYFRIGVHVNQTLITVKELSSFLHVYPKTSIFKHIKISGSSTCKKKIMKNLEGNQYGRKECQKDKN